MLKPLSEIGIQIKKKREDLRWNQTELAKLSGVSRATISRLETGTAKDVKLSVLDKLGVVLGCLKLTKSFEGGYTMRIGKAAREMGLHVNSDEKILYPVTLPGVDIRYDVLTPELLAKVAQCSE